MSMIFIVCLFHKASPFTCPAMFNSGSGHFCIWCISFQPFCVDLKLHLLKPNGYYEYVRCVLLCVCVCVYECIPNKVAIGSLLNFSALMRSINVWYGMPLSIDVRICIRYMLCIHSIQQNQHVHKKIMYFIVRIVLTNVSPLNVICFPIPILFYSE